MKKTLLALLLSLSTLHADSVNLIWDPSPTVGVSYRLYQSVGLNPFSVAIETGTATIASVTVVVPTRFYVTAFSPAGESVPSNTITYTPVIAGTVTISVPVLSPTIALPGAIINAAATFRNETSAPFIIAEGVITARRPGASNDAGPFDNFTPVILAQTVPVGATIAISGSWTVPVGAPVGQWRAYIAIRDSLGAWIDGPNAFFQVIAAPTVPPAPPTNLRATPLSASRIDLQWSPYTLSSVFVERNQTLVAIVPSTQSFYLDTGLRKNRFYSYRIRGDGTDYSNTTSARTFSH